MMSMSSPSGPFSR